MRTQATWLRIDSDTPPVLERQTGTQKKTNQEKLSPPFQVHTARVKEKPFFRLWPTCFRKGCARPPFDLQNYSHNQGGTKKKGTPSFQKHTMFTLDQKIEGNWPANTTQKGSLLTFPLLRYSPSTVREKPCDSFTRALPWHCEHRRVWIFLKKLFFCFVDLSAPPVRNRRLGPRIPLTGVSASESRQRSGISKIATWNNPRKQTAHFYKKTLLTSMELFHFFAALTITKKDRAHQLLGHRARLGNSRYHLSKNTTSSLAHSGGPASCKKVVHTLSHLPKLTSQGILLGRRSPGGIFCFTPGAILVASFGFVRVEPQSRDLGYRFSVLDFFDTRVYEAFVA